MKPRNLFSNFLSKPSKLQIGVHDGIYFLFIIFRFVQTFVEISSFKLIAKITLQNIY